MFEFRTGVAGGGDVADFLELQRTLEGDRVMSLAAHEEEVLRPGVFLCDRGDLGFEFQGARHEVGELFHFRDDVAAVAVR